MKVNVYVRGKLRIITSVHDNVDRASPAHIRTFGFIQLVGLFSVHVKAMCMGRTSTKHVWIRMRLAQYILALFYSLQAV